MEEITQPVSNPVLQKGAKTNPGALILVVVLGLVVFVETGILLNNYLYYQAVGEEIPASIIHRVKPTVAPMATTTPATSVETANWKTYISNNFYFSLKYPANFTPEDSLAPAGPKSGGVSFSTGDICSKDAIQFGVNYNNPGVTYTVLSSEPIIVDTLPATLNIADLPKDDHCVVIGKFAAGEQLHAGVSLVRNGVKWDFFAIIRVNKRENDLVLFKKILSMFRFTK